MRLGLEKILNNTNVIAPIHENIYSELAIDNMYCENSMSAYVELQREYVSLTTAVENLKGIYDLSLTGELSKDLLSFLKAPLAQLGYTIEDGDNTISSEAILETLKKGGVWLKDKLLELLETLINTIKYMFNRNRRLMAASRKTLRNWIGTVSVIEATKDKTISKDILKISDDLFNKNIVKGPNLATYDTVKAFPSIIEDLYARLQKITIKNLINPKFNLWNKDMSSLNITYDNNDTSMIHIDAKKADNAGQSPKKLGYPNIAKLNDVCLELDIETKQLFSNDKSLIKLHKQLKKEINVLYKEGKVSDEDRNIALKNFNTISNYMNVLSSVGSTCIQTIHFLTTSHNRAMRSYLIKNYVKLVSTITKNRDVVEDTIFGITNRPII